MLYDSHMRLRFLLAVIALPVLAQNPVTDAIKANYNRIRQNLIETADVMPESGYSFKLTPAQRNFGEWIEHTALSAYGNCSAIMGTQSPAAAKTLANLKTKAELSKALKDAFEYCDAAFKEMDDRKATTEVSIGDRKLYPVTPAIGLITGLNEHYGNLVGYMRSNGVVPPSTARAASAKKK